jgi:hypothetical protein
VSDRIIALRPGVLDAIEGAYHDLQHALDQRRVRGLIVGLPRGMAPVALAAVRRHVPGRRWLGVGAPCRICRMPRARYTPAERWDVPTVKARRGGVRYPAGPPAPHGIQIHVQAPPVPDVVIRHDLIAEAYHRGRLGYPPP